jgi:ATP-dependent DNA helicase 2 subunit 2
VPKRVVRARKDGHIRAADDDDETLLLDRFPKANARGASASQTQTLRGTASQAGPSKKANANDSATEDEEEPLLLDAVPTRSTNAGSKHSSKPHLPSPTRSASPPVDAGRAPGRIIGAAYPLRDFKKNIARGDLVTKAVEDLGAVIVEVVTKPFASRRHVEMLECMAAMRDTALQEDEIDAWNE